MTIKIKDMLETQREVDNKVRANTTQTITNESLILAFNVELFEFFNEVGVWKWWKKSHVTDRGAVLEELADVTAFFLSLINMQNAANVAAGKVEIIDQIEKGLNEVMSGLMEDYKAHKEEVDDNEVIKGLITHIGVDNETEGVFTIDRYAISVFIASVLFDDLKWSDVVASYELKSAENIARQDGDY